MELFFYLIMLQAIMGAFDTLYHHEFLVALPRSLNARQELAIHGVRALLYGVIFFALAWYEWHGMWVFVLAGLILTEIYLTLWDFIIEDSSRLLPASERVLHTLLAINGGAAFVLLALEFPKWYAQETAMFAVDYGWISWFMSLAGLGVAISGIRDGLAAWSVQRMQLKLDLDLGGHRRILISGATGFIGSALCHELLAGGHELTVLSRNPLSASIQFQGRLRSIQSCDELADDTYFDIIINLAGASVVGFPWTPKRRKILQVSRFTITRQLIDFVKRTSYRPKVWIQASAIGYYGSEGKEKLDESAPCGTGFAAQLCQSWELLTQELEHYGVRRVVLRFGMVFGRSGGSLPMMILSFRLGLGAKLGQGHQYVSWIHIEDLLGLIALCIRKQDINGVFNAVAPHTPQYGEFAQLLAQLLSRPLLLNLPRSLLIMLMGEMASLFVDGPPIISQRLQQLNYEYRFPNLRSALMDLS